jgi:ATP adenylyltransferase
MSNKFDELSYFIRNNMKMSQIYQPVMLIELLRKGGSASVREIAKVILDHDTSQIEYYEKTIKNMPGKVLGNKRNQITETIKQGKKIVEY